MFIKRDRRKINQILKEGGEDGEKLTTLKLSKRAAEFQGNTRVLFQEPKVDMLLNLRVLNLYDNELSSVPNIGMLSRTPLEKINLGCNKLRELPLDFGTIATLRTVWLDDNEFTVFPTCVCQIKGLQSLRISGNRITHIPALISSLEYLETLAADNNELTEFPSGCRLLSRLKNLWLRQNKISALPSNLDGMHSLEILSLSSNQITSLPDCIASLPNLKKLFANGNKITVVPDQLPLIIGLQEVNLANNLIFSLPELWEATWGTLDQRTGLLDDSLSDGEDSETSTKKTCTVKVNVLGNPIQQAPSCERGVVLAQ